MTESGEREGQMMPLQGRVEKGEETLRDGLSLICLIPGISGLPLAINPITRRCERGVSAVGGAYTYMTALTLHRGPIAWEKLSDWKKESHVFPFNLEKLHLQFTSLKDKSWWRILIWENRCWVLQQHHFPGLTDRKFTTYDTCCRSKGICLCSPPARNNLNMKVNLKKERGCRSSAQTWSVPFHLKIRVWKVQ